MTTAASPGVNRPRRGGHLDLRREIVSAFEATYERPPQPKQLDGLEVVVRWLIACAAKDGSVFRRSARQAFVGCGWMRSVDDLDVKYARARYRNALINRLRYLVDMGWVEYRDHERKSDGAGKDMVFAVSANVLGTHGWVAQLARATKRPSRRSRRPGAPPGPDVIHELFGERDRGPASSSGGFAPPYGLAEASGCRPHDDDSRWTAGVGARVASNAREDWLIESRAADPASFNRGAALDALMRDCVIEEARAGRPRGSALRSAARSGEDPVAVAIAGWGAAFGPSVEDAPDRWADVEGEQTVLRIGGLVVRQARDELEANAVQVGRWKLLSAPHPAISARRREHLRVSCRHLDRLRGHTGAGLELLLDLIDADAHAGVQPRSLGRYIAELRRQARGERRVARGKPFHTEKTVTGADGEQRVVRSDWWLDREDRVGEQRSDELEAEFRVKRARIKRGRRR